MKRLLRRTIELLPGRAPWLFLERLRRIRYPALRHRHRAEQALLSKLGNPRRVLSGPFADMRYSPAGYFGARVAKVLGVYERELHETLTQLCAAGFIRWIDIGAAEGYYAVGIAVKSPTSDVVAFESYGSARSMIERAAVENNVAGRVRVFGECTLEALRAVLSVPGRTAVLCDCEGGEDVLLDPRANPKLREATILVEVHDGYVPGVGERLRARFAASHDIRVIEGQRRSARDLPAPLELSETEIEVAVDESRGPGRWFLFTPQDGGRSRSS